MERLHSLNAALVIALVLAGCKADGFKGAPNAPVEPPAAAAGEMVNAALADVSFPCNLSGSAIRIQAPAGRPSFSVGITGACGIAGTSVSQASSPTDIVFVLDVSTTMTSHLNTVKSGVAQLVTALSASGVNARFGAVSYVDEVVQRIPLSDAGTFTAQIQPWTVLDLGNLDYPEGGQSGIRAGMALLAQGTGQQKALLLVTDAISFSSSASRMDFTTMALGAEMRAQMIGPMSALRFFHSSPEVPPQGTYGGNLPPTVRAQYERLRADASNIPGRALPFPFTSAVLLGDFQSSILESRTQNTCRLSSVAPAAPTSAVFTVEAANAFRVTRQGTQGAGGTEASVTLIFECQASAGIERRNIPLVITQM